MASIGTGWHMRCEVCGKRIKGARFYKCKQCRERQGQEMTKTININGCEVEAHLNPDRRIIWCSDWAALTRASAKGDKRIGRIHHGPATYGDCSYYLK